MNCKLIAVSLLLFAAASVVGQTRSEQVLIPFETAVVEGADGTRWSAELRVRNASDVEVNLFPEQCSWIGRPLPCDLRVIVPPRTTKLLDALVARSSNSGLLLYVPLDRIDDVQFSLQVRELRSGDSVGTRVPVARARDLKSQFTIIGVPISDDQRRTLRVYEPHLPVQSVFRVRVFDEASNRMLLDREYSGGSPTDSPSPVLVPATFDFSDALASSLMAGAQRVTVSIARIFPAGLTFWPMISSTSNVDHRVAIFVAN